MKSISKNKFMGLFELSHYCSMINHNLTYTVKYRILSAAVIIIFFFKLEGAAVKWKRLLKNYYFFGRKREIGKKPNYTWTFYTLNQVYFWSSSRFTLLSVDRRFSIHTSIIVK